MAAKRVPLVVFSGSVQQFLHHDLYREFFPHILWLGLISSLTSSWGSPEFIGLGFLSFVSIILTEMFGSPFLKNISIIVGLAVGCIVAGPAGYIDGSSITAAPAITFLW
jgi:xanthine/uracil permease